MFCCGVAVLANWPQELEGGKQVCCTLYFAIYSCLACCQPGRAGEAALLRPLEIQYFKKTTNFMQLGSILGCCNWSRRSIGIARARNALQELASRFQRDLVEVHCQMHFTASRLLMFAIYLANPVFSHVQRIPWVSFQRPNRARHIGACKQSLEIFNHEIDLPRARQRLAMLSAPMQKQCQCLLLACFRQRHQAHLLHSSNEHCHCTHERSMFSKLGPITFAEVVGQMANTLLTFGPLEIARSHCCTIKRLKQEFLLLRWQVAVINCFQETQCHCGIQVATF